MNHWHERVLRTPQSERDIDEQVDYYSNIEGRHGVALRFSRSVEETLAAILVHPEAGSPCQWKSPRLGQLRWQLVRGFPDHLILYRVNGTRIVVVRVLHGARDRDNMLAELEDG